jgi:MoxR-like ATPase
MPKKIDRNIFISAVTEKYGEIEVVSRQQIVDVCEEANMKWPAWLTQYPEHRAGRGLYSLKPNVIETEDRSKETKNVESNNLAQVDMALALAHSNDSVSVQSLIPHKAVGYVPFGHFNDVRTIVKSGKFYPLYITGLSGNGKTMMVEQVCATEKRECIRVNITIETDEDDILGGFRLVDGKTVWHNGPAIQAMERGAVLLLDEIDLGSNRLMCLQPVLEGNPIFLKKINKLVTPASGFNIIATANTKGKGSDDGRFIGTNVMNEAFLERFSITLEQEYPQPKVEQKILSNVLISSGISDPEFVDKLVQWSEVIRKSFYEGAVSEIISTRRLVHICEAFAIFNQDREKAITLCLNRFDIDTKNSFLDLYKKLDETIAPPAPVTPTEVPVVDDTGAIPF